MKQKAWNWLAVNSQEREFWSTPSGNVFEFILRLKQSGKSKVYDLGCGLGRHLFLLIESGFEVHGSDFSLDAVKEVNEELEKLECPNRVKHESMTEISEQDDSYDAVIAYNVIYHSYLADMLKTFRNIHRILKSGGYLLITFQAKTSPIYNKDDEVEPGTIVKKYEPEAGIPHHLVDREETISMFSDFHILDLKYVEHEYDGMRHKGCHFVVTAVKR
ncbi:methyltransferase domain-containing protein [Candidatus Poribacteria bacterium]|nr:methyltransferase domain-containing protein [Candidatus Poribacteria bacterium]